MVQEQIAGRLGWKRPPTFYEQFMEEQNIPIHRGIGVYDVRDVTLAPWKRMGAQGAFIELDGTGGLTGMYLIEIPAGGATNVEKHMYEEIFYVVEGRGSTEIWTDDESKKQAFEWQKGTLFTAPLNTSHRIVNASSSPALLLGVTNAPPVMALYRNTDFIFNTPFHFSERYNQSPEYFVPMDEIGTRPDNGRYHNYSNIIPDTINTEIPLDGQRGSGHRHYTWNLGGNTFMGHIAEYPSGRYSKCHAHESGPVLLCLGGRGYSITWPKDAGTRPWEAGNGHLVKRQDYIPGGLVSAAPGDANWFHGHFGTSREPLRVIAFLGGYPRRVRGAPGDDVISQNQDIQRGGLTIEYHDEDPYIRRMYQEELAKTGAVFDMAEELYHPR